jgi:plasmid maintenance system antidote protein VapI
MIKKLLNLLLEERILDKNEIARRIGVQIETLDDIVRLKRKAYASMTGGRK